MIARMPRIIYLVDDDDAVRDSLRVLLETYGLRVEDYASPAQFLAQPRDFEDTCLVVDVHMPEMNGFDLLEILKRRKSAPIAIAITGAGDAVLRARLKYLGAREVLDKPVGDDVLVESIARAFAAREHAHSP